MKKLVILGTALAAMSLSAFAADWDNVTQDFAVSNEAIGLAENIRGVDINPATGNLIVSDTSGNLAVINATTGALVSNIANASTDSGTIGLYRVRCSDDGAIYVNGFDGSVNIVTSEAVLDAGPVSNEIISPTGSGNSRALDVVGSHSAGTAKVLVGLGVDVQIWGNSPASPETYTLLDTITTTITGDMDGVAANSAVTSVYIQEQGESMQRWDGSIGGSWADGSLTTNGEQTWRISFAFEETTNQGAAFSGHSAAVGSYVLGFLFDLDDSLPSGAGVDNSNGYSASSGAGWYSFHTAAATNGTADACVVNTGRVFAGGNDGVAGYTAGVVPVELSVFSAE